MKEDLIDIFKYGVVMFVVFFVTIILLHLGLYVCFGDTFNIYDCMIFSLKMSFMFSVTWTISISLSYILIHFID